MSPLSWFGIGVAVFAAATAYDLVYACYLRAANRGNSLAAGGWSVATYLIGLVGLAGVIKFSPFLVVPEVVGLYVGTVIGVEFTADRD